MIDLSDDEGKTKCFTAGVYGWSRTLESTRAEPPASNRFWQMVTAQGPFAMTEYRTLLLLLFS